MPESLGPMASSELDFLGKLGRSVAECCKWCFCEMAFLFHRLSVVIECYNSVLVHESIIFSVLNNTVKHYSFIAS